ncbi:hypothetical protein HMPREF9098_0544 [Kingella denitrificans ATCC 33394]|uniref:Uncharacterized protein n=1 Tax=Kingella denitrificans ATCC 33394 TaxID=888741 RepID=F0EXG0_9NEIS|nr:hypothetical protein HMPREF9098_0544 [Kingella denitrificans ATCC 33394]
MICGIVAFFIHLHPVHIRPMRVHCALCAAEPLKGGALRLPINRSAEK